MRNLIVSRHGNYLGSKLTDEGQKQIAALGVAIRKTIDDGSVYLISSTAPRALESARILAANLGLPEFEEIPYLWSGSDAPEGSYEWDFGVDKYDKLMKLIDERKSKADTLVMVTHLEVVNDFRGYFMDREFGSGKRIKEEIRKGESIHFNLEGKSYQILPKKKAV